MSDPVRLAGHARHADGRRVTWSVADGRLGRRWRVVVTRDEGVTLSLLLEVGVGGRPARLELATPSGLLTLHPEAEASLHGNAVTADGVRHLALAWSPEHELEIEGLPLGAAVTARRLAGSISIGEGRAVPVVTVAGDLSVNESTRRFDRLASDTWRISDDDEGEPWTLRLDERGLPAWFGGEGEWPLELEPRD